MTGEWQNGGEVNVAAHPSPSSFPGIGPKRVRTRDLDIEQFDPDKLDKLEQRRNSKIPTFCDSHICIGVPVCGPRLRNY